MSPPAQKFPKFPFLSVPRIATASIFESAAHSFRILDKRKTISKESAFIASGLFRVISPMPLATFEIT